MSYIKKGTSTFRKVNLAFFAGGLTTFAVLYCIQPLMPVFSKEFHISPTVASLSLSLTTITMAVSMLILGSLSEAWGRKPIMIFAMLSAAILTVLTSFVTNFHIILLFRVLLGGALAGLPAIAMAYLGEEIEPKSLGVAMGLYISGNSIGGMGGRIVISMLTDYFNWHIALGAIGAIGIITALLFIHTLPPSKNFQPRQLKIGKMVKSMGSHFKDHGLLCLFGIGFLLMGSFVSTYNYIGYQLISPPYSLSQTLVGWLFVIFLVGTFSSTWMGRLADKYGRRQVMWVAFLIMFVGISITLISNLLIKVGGLAIFTFGFFGGHSIASSWVGRRATHDKAQASSLYLFFYYVGSSIGGTAGGFFWTAFGWIGVVGMIGSFIILGLILSFRLSTIKPLEKIKSI